MLNVKQFLSINNEVKEKIVQSLDKLKIENLGNYILFLADAQYVENVNTKISQYTIDYRLDEKQDSARIEFLTDFLNNYYKFSQKKQSTEYNPYRINIELMIYSHIWESKSFLKKMYRLAHLTNDEEYDWNVKVPPTAKHDFIINKVRKIFSDNNIRIWEVIKNGFHTSLRNAFAHSEYSFETMNNLNRINLYNYSGKDWELKYISFNNWSLRFVYSALLNFHFFNIILERRLNLIEELGTDTFLIKHPKRTGDLVNRKVKYIKNGNSFIFV